MAKPVLLPTLKEILFALGGIFAGLYFYTPFISAFHQSQSSGNIVLPSWVNGFISTVGNYSPEVAGLLIAVFALGAISLFSKIKTFLVWFFITIAGVSLLSIAGLNIPDVSSMVHEWLGSLL